MKKLIKRNNITEGLIYMQVTRGVAERDFAYPEDAEQTIIAFTQEKELDRSGKSPETGIRIISIPDIRWHRRDIKSTGMLAQAMGKEASKRAGVDDAWMVEDGVVTEGHVKHGLHRGRRQPSRDTPPVQQDSARHHPSHDPEAG